MATIDGTHQRLIKAVNRLEAAAERIVREREALGAELAALRADHDKLSAALLQSEEDYGALQAMAEAVSHRLDAAIGQLKSVLEG
ncbi:MAG: DUF4164 family protein [Alphaproteobacteria bacterium]